MKISLLLQREPFKRVFCQTLARYLTTTSGRAHRVSWHDRPAPLGQIARGTSGLWLCNPTLNIIYSARAQSRIFVNPWREFLIGPSPLHTLAHGLYLGASTAPPGRLFLPRIHLHIEPDIDAAESMLILGGNSRLRIIDFARGQVVSILKQGFDDRAFRRELQIRLSAPPPLSPPLLEVRDAGRAFVEPLLRAYSAGRMLGHRGKKRGQQALRQVTQACAQWSQDSIEQQNWPTWWNNHHARCNELAAQIDNDSKGHVARLMSWMQQTKNELENLGVAAAGVPTALSHGDLQSGNILVDNARPWLIDWESVDRRVVDYDAWTLALGPRYRVAGRREKLRQLARHDLSHQSEKKQQIRVLLYLLAEARFYLEESAIGPLYGPTPGTQAFVQSLLA